MHGGDEHGDAIALRGVREVGEQDRSDTEAVSDVLDFERDLRAVCGCAHVGGVTDDPLRRPDGCDKPVAATAATVGGPARHRVEVHARGKEAQPAGLD